MGKIPRNKSRHHRRPKVRGGTLEKSNVSIVTKKAHRAYHLLFGVMTPQQVAEELNRKWIGPQWELVAVRR